MTDLFKLILGALASLFKSRARLEAEILVVRQQINVLRRRTPKRPRLNNTDRFLFVWLYSWFPVLGAVAIVRRYYSDRFRTRWSALLGVRSHSVFDPLPWQSVKAVTRRYAQNLIDGYPHRPIVA